MAGVGAPAITAPAAAAAAGHRGAAPRRAAARAAFGNAAAAPPSARPYTVRPGDTVSSICRKRGFDEKQVYAMNPMLRGGEGASTLSPGQTILVPGAKYSARDMEILAGLAAGVGKGGVRTYPAREGETAEAVASVRDVTMAELRELNPGLNVRRKLKGGETLVLPPGKFSERELEMLQGILPTSSYTGKDAPNLITGLVNAVTKAKAGAGARPYTVRAGDTVGSICAKRDIPIDLVISLNPVLKESGGDVLLAGEKLLIPGHRYSARDREIMAGIATGVGKGGTRTYPLREGERLTDVLRARDISMAEVEELNPGVNLKQLPAGATIILPGKFSRREREVLSGLMPAQVTGSANTPLAGFATVSLTAAVAAIVAGSWLSKRWSSGK